MVFLFYLFTIPDPAVFVAASPSQTFLKCGGRCGEPKCSALFISAEDLAKHVDAAKHINATGLPQCVQVSRVYDLWFTHCGKVYWLWLCDQYCLHVVSSNLSVACGVPGSPSDLLGSG